MTILSQKNLLLFFVAITFALSGFVLLAGGEKVGALTPETCTISGSPPVLLNYDSESVQQSGSCAADNMQCKPGFTNKVGNGTDDTTDIIKCSSLGGGGSPNADPLRDAAFASIGQGTDICDVRTGLSQGEIDSLAGKDHVIDGLSANNTAKIKVADKGQLVCTYSLIKQIITWITFGIGVVALVLILFSGFLYMTAGEAEEKTDKAKKTLVAAIAGFAIVLLARVILRILQSVL